MRLLIAEDNDDLRDILAKTLAAEGYSVDAARDGEEGWDYVDSLRAESDTGGYDAIILDILMPKMNGLDLLTKIRANKIDTPILLLTAMDSIEDRVKGLDLGANDYLIKPFSSAELLARIRAMTRISSHTSALTNTFTCGDLTLDASSHTVERNGDAISLSSREFSILEYMIRNQGIVLSRDRIERHTRSFDESDSGVGSNVIDVYIRYLRRKIDDPYDKKLIQTVRGAGYTLKSDN